MIIEIKQIAIDNPNQPKYKSSYGEFTREPSARASYRVSKDQGGKFITGLDEEQETRLGRILNKDLSNVSDFWSKEFRMNFDLRKGSMTLNTKEPYSEIFVAAAKANKWLADDKEALLDDVLLKRRTIYYIDNKEEQIRKKVSLIELKDEIGSLLHSSKNNRDRLFWIAQKIGEFSTRQYKEESLYSIISLHREKLTNKEKLENFRDILKLTNVQLQAGYYVKEGISRGIIPVDNELKQFKFLDKHTGKTQQNTVDFFSDKKNDTLLGMLINEVDAK